MWHHVRKEIKKGVTVTVTGTSKAALNGTVGVAEDQNEDKSRWNVVFEGKDGDDPTTRALKPENLETDLVPCPRGNRCNDLTARCGRDRYPSSVCSSGTRVRLSDDAYINANYIRYPDYALRMSGRHVLQQKGDVVVTQGPLNGTDGDKTNVCAHLDGCLGKKREDKSQPYCKKKSCTYSFEKGKYDWPEGHGVPKEFAKGDWEFKDTRPQFWQMVRME